MNDNPVFDITVSWESYGWVAVDKPKTNESRHCSGPREAAEDLCAKIFFQKPFKLTFKAKGWYQAQAKNIT